MTLRVFYLDPGAELGSWNRTVPLRDGRLGGNGAFLIGGGGGRGASFEGGNGGVLITGVGELGFTTTSVSGGDGSI